MQRERRSLLRGDDTSVSPVELFFDLVFVFAITQLSHALEEDLSWGGIGRTVVLLAMVWQVWVYTTWAINYLDPRRSLVRGLLLALTLGSLVLAAELGDAFGDRGWVVAIVYVVMQVGRGLFVMAAALRGDPLQMAFLRFTIWSLLSGTLVLIGAAQPTHVREILWAAAVALDLVAASFGFWLPGVGRSETTDWTISGSHFAERCQAFVLIALGESIVVTGGRLAALHSPSAAEVTAFVVAFAGSAGLWWIYFDRAAEDSAEIIAESPDPGRLARNAFHWVQPVIIAGIVVGATADAVVLEHPADTATTVTGWLVLGGIALYLLGHAVFKIVIWHRASWPRIGGAAVCLALLPVAPHVSALTLAILGVVVISAVAVADRLINAGREVQPSATE